MSSETYLRKAFTAKAEGDNGEITAVIATLNVVDRHSDVILPGALGGMTGVGIGQFNHESIFGAHPWIGYGVLSEVGNEIVLNGQLFLAMDAAAEQWKSLQGMGEKQEWSFFFRLKQWSFGEFGASQDQVRFIEKMEAREVSPVAFGAGINTRTVSVKSLTGGYEGYELVYADALPAKADAPAAAPLEPVAEAAPPPRALPSPRLLQAWSKFNSRRVS